MRKQVKNGEYKQIAGNVAEPTNRVLSGSSHSWAAEEWSEQVLYNGQPATLYYLFDSDEVEQGAQGEGDASYYPWDECYKEIELN